MERTLLKIAFGTTREARPADAARIVQMVGELAAHHGDTSSLTADGLARDALGDPPWLHLLVAESAGEMIGYTALRGLIQLQFGARGMDLHHLFTAPGHRGRGVGHVLVAASAIRARALSCR